MKQQPMYKPSTPERFNKSERVEYYRPSRESFLNSCVEKLRQEIKDKISLHLRFQRNNLSKRERAALKSLSNNRDIIKKPADQGEATVIFNKKYYITEAMRQLSNGEYYKKSRKRPFLITNS